MSVQPRILLLVLGAIWFVGCSGPMSHYAKVERSLLAGNSAQAVTIMQSAKEDYGDKNRLLYLLDQGMVLHLAQQYVESNKALEEANTLVEELYTKHLRDEASALLVNEAQRPFVGDPFEHVMINVVKALNYAALQQWNEALVEGRRIDHRLNVLHDKQEGTETYQEDPFARYLVGLLYDITGDLNNAYVGYRKAEQVYEDSQEWSRVVFPDILKADLIRTAERLGLSDEVRQYREKYPEIGVASGSEGLSTQAQLIVISYYGEGPKKEDVFIDVPVSLDALYLVALTKPWFGRSTRDTRGGESLLYGLHGQIARIALPRLTMKKTTVAYDVIEVTNQTAGFKTQSERVYDIGAVAEKNLADEYDALVLRAVARSAMKMAAAEGIAIGARAAAGRNNQGWVGLLVGAIARILALATEEADVRSWRTLPGEFQLTRLWVKPGDYSLAIQSMDHQGRKTGGSQQRHLQLIKGETTLVIHQSLQ